jgi:hypothetical protein
MQRNNLKLTSVLFVAAIAAIYSVTPRSTDPKRTVMYPAKPASKIAEMHKEAGTAAKASGTAAEAEALALVEQLPENSPIGDGSGGNGADDPEVYTGAEAPPEVTASHPAGGGGGGHGAAYDPHVYSGAEAPPSATPARARNDGAAARGATAPLLHHG